mmetsp:Transcript_1375/g.2080  ORF Transcript_1375/g.2080 Transcript_1375/m.2080 type:complete len:122 (+) Transcript_1375:316-681(+)
MDFGVAGLGWGLGDVSEAEKSTQRARFFGGTHNAIDEGSAAAHATAASILKSQLSTESKTSVELLGEQEDKGESNASVGSEQGSETLDAELEFEKVGDRDETGVDIRRFATEVGGKSSTMP